MLHKPCLQNKSSISLFLAGGVNLEAALEQSSRLFAASEGGRPSAKKVLVVMVDKKSDSDLEGIKDAANVIIQDGIRIVAVAIGNEADRKELEPLTPNEDDLLMPQNLDRVPDKIIERAVNGMFRITSCWWWCW